jgi:glyoxylase-like metal-dependent hydrolase (beta-lactamase superfamily II)
MELLKGVNQIKVPLPRVGMDSVNVYIIEGTNGNLMIDTGWNTPEAFNALAQEMKNSGFAMKDITDIVLTHIHPDHFGLAGKLAELTGARVFLSEIENGMVESRYVSSEKMLADMASFLQSNGVPDWELKTLVEASAAIRGYVSSVGSFNVLKAGDHVAMEPFDFQVVLTPGHSPGHICLYEPNKKYLFSGDQVLAEIVPSVSYHPQSGENPLGDYVRSLNALGELEVRFVFPGHGSIFSGLAPKIEDIVRFHRDRTNSIQNAMGVEMKNGYDLAKGLPWIVNGDPVAYDKLEPIDRRLAVLDVLSHLQYLNADGKGKKVVESGKTVYWAGV